ncbi:MAG: flagellar FlbD family protein [Acidobacteria bacterium]|nr:flagellar FlbD family protein [Acidobacteriota bacterium]
MIRLTRLNHELMVLNCELIEHIEQTPDTVITLVNGQKWMVRENPDEIISKVVDYRRRIQSGVCIRDLGSDSGSVR